MSLHVYPPPNRFPLAPNTTGRFPASATVPGQTLAQGNIWSYIPIFGRNGAAPDATLASWLRESIDGNSRSTDWYFNGSWTNWSYWNASSEMGGKRFVGISIELRTAAEVTAAVPGHGDGVVFACTGWDGTAGFPPFDGVDDSGFTYASGWNNMRFIRILIREDLAAGGAGADWSGRDFLIETLAHELGHAATMLLANLYGDDFVIQNICDLFGKPTAQWDDPGIPWGERVVEANAELFKDVFYPKRRYFSRAAYKLPFSRYDDWVQLFYELLYTPYWIGNNRSYTLRAKTDTFFDNIGICSFALNMDAQLLKFRPPDVPLNVFENALAWPPDGNWGVNWAYDPRPISDPGFGEWRGGNYPDSLVSFFDAVPPGMPNAPGNVATPQLALGFYDTGANIFNLSSSARTNYGSIAVNIRDMGTTDLVRDLDGNPVGLPVPPSSGRFRIEIPPDLLAAVPPEGCNVVAAFSGRTLPKYALPGEDYVWPWIDLSLRRVPSTVFPPPYPPYPTPPTPPTPLTIGAAAVGVVRFEHTRVRQG